MPLYRQSQWIFLQVEWKLNADVKMRVHVFWCRMSELNILINKIIIQSLFSLGNGRMKILCLSFFPFSLLYCICRCQKPLWNFNFHFLKMYKAGSFLKIYKHIRCFSAKYKTISELRSQLQVGFQSLSALRREFVQSTHARLALLTLSIG